MTALAAKPDNFAELGRMFTNCPKTIDEIRNTVGDSGELLDFWFDYAMGGKHAVFYKFRRDGETQLKFALLVFE